MGASESGSNWCPVIGCLRDVQRHGTRKIRGSVRNDLDVANPASGIAGNNPVGQVTGHDLARFGPSAVEFASCPGPGIVRWAHGMLSQEVKFRGSLTKL